MGAAVAVGLVRRELREEGLIHSRGHFGRFVGPEGTKVRRPPTKGEALAEEIASRIQSGRYQPGEKGLVEEFGSNRKVVRAALALPRERDLVTTQAPKGTFVKKLN
ncbi:GntR family transcriptional regulator [Nonomuraea sp. NPDC049784]|uniref:GntR family transcriptional regulator n=1 Tax=Nonomuraea sp. NPDC049784 TaxID=3154361 RepID=UPI0034029A35